MSISVDEKHLLNKLRKLKDKSSTNEVHHLSNFLNVREQELYNSVFKDDYYYQLFGGYDESEYKRAIYSTDYNFDFKITILEIIRTDKMEISHRHVLGTVMATGITRDSIGDILISDSYIYIFARDSIANHLINEVKSILGVLTELRPVNNVKVGRTQNYVEKKIFIDSLRLDNLISKAYNINRSLAKELIDKDFVKIDQIGANKPTKKIAVGSIISVRKYGRFKILNDGGFSKSGKNIIVICLYK